MSLKNCDLVSRYLESFLDKASRSTFDLQRVSDHVSGCFSCLGRFNAFFRTMELPESAYLTETLDEMAKALYNLGKAIIRDRPPVNDDDVTENVVITEQGGGSVQENIEVGEEMIEDAEDYAGSSHVQGTDLEQVRELMSDAESSRKMRLDVALQIFSQVSTLETSHTSKAWNWVGVLHLQKEEFDQAEAAFRRALAAPDGAMEVRAKAHCNLGYVYKNRGDLDRAIKSSERAVVLAEEDGEDPYFGQFAAVYFRLLRSAENDEDAALAILRGFLDAGQDRRFHDDLHLEANAKIREVFSRSVLGRQFPQLLD